MGEAFAGRKLGVKAMLWGALAQSIPDIDFLAAFWMDTPDTLMAHRGFTHSILFSIVVTFILAYLAEKWHRPHNISFRRWASFFGAVILTHIFLDAFNSYGVGWFEPFSHDRISFNAIYVADPFFSIVPGLAFLMLLVLKKSNRKKVFWWKISLVIPFIYLCYCIFNKSIIDQEVRQYMKKAEIKADRYFTTPAPMQPWLWYIVIHSDEGYLVDYHSVFDKKDRFTLNYFPANESLVKDAPDQKEMHKLIQFSQGYYTMQQRMDTLLFYDLRFGQVIGWDNPKEEFAFYYYLIPKLDNTLVIQRGRFAKWNRQSFHSFWRRICGKEID